MEEPEYSGGAGADTLKNFGKVNPGSLAGLQSQLYKELWQS